MIENLPDGFKPSEYTAFGSFIPKHRAVNDYIWERIGSPLARPTIAVLDAILYHCDGYGLCFPLKLTTVKKKAHLRWENAVEGLCVLVETLGWLREVRTPMPRKRVQVDWQISPFVLHIKPERIEEALELWQKSLLISPQVFRAEHKPESKPENKNQHRKTRESTSRKTRDGQKNFHKEVDIEICRVALSNPADETFAHYIAKECKTHLTVARQMILTYGRLETENAVGSVKDTMKNGDVINPGGLLRTELRTRAYKANKSSTSSGAAGASAGD